MHVLQHSIHQVLLIDYFRIRSVTVSHFVLHLRAVYLDSEENGNRLIGSLVHFASNVTGNLGAPLEFRHEQSQIPSVTSQDPLAEGILPRSVEKNEEWASLLCQR